jgi:hypothetical protein
MHPRDTIGMSMPVLPYRTVGTFGGGKEEDDDDDDVSEVVSESSTARSAHSVASRRRLAPAIVERDATMRSISSSDHISIMAHSPLSILSMAAWP